MLVVSPIHGRALHHPDACRHCSSLIYLYDLFPNSTWFCFCPYLESLCVQWFRKTQENKKVLFCSILQWTLSFFSLGIIFIQFLRLYIHVAPTMSSEQINHSQQFWFTQYLTCLRTIDCLVLNQALIKKKTWLSSQENRIIVLVIPEVKVDIPWLHNVYEEYSNKFRKMRWLEHKKSVNLLLLLLVESLLKPPQIVCI